MYNIKRPTSYSESHIQLPRIQSSLQSLIEDIPRTPPASPPLTQKPTAKAIIAWPSSDRVMTMCLQICVHLTLISLFETIFFWQFVSQTEDTALTSLITDYVSDLTNSCVALTPAQRSVIGALINVTAIDGGGQVAYAARYAYNRQLEQLGWLYFGGLFTVSSLLSMVAIRRGMSVNWHSVLGENAVLVTLLAFYEWMFFETIVFRYRAITMPELDAYAVNLIAANCLT